jgi:hypothetical protein
LIIISGFEETIGATTGAGCLVKALACLLVFTPIFCRGKKQAKASSSGT